MKSIKVSRRSKLLLILAVWSFIIAVLEAALFYPRTNMFFDTLMILQNGINAFAFKPSISLSDAMRFMETNNDALHMIIGYMYGVAVFTAPYCTVAVVYKFLRQHRTTRLKKQAYPQRDIPTLICIRKAHFIRPTSLSCQPDKDSPVRM